IAGGPYFFPPPTLRCPRWPRPPPRRTIARDPTTPFHSGDEGTVMMRLRFALALLLAAAAYPLGLDAGRDPPPFGKVPPPDGLVARDAKVSAAAVVCFLEGPAADARGNVFFSDIAGNRILKRAPDGKVSVFRADSGRTNGNAFDARGRLISCEGGPRGRRPLV